MMLNSKGLAICEAVMSVTLCFVTTKASKIPNANDAMQEIFPPAAIEWIAKERYNSTDQLSKHQTKAPLRTTLDLCHSVAERKCGGNATRLLDLLCVLLYTADGTGPYKEVNCKLRNRKPHETLKSVLGPMNKFYDHLINGLRNCKTSSSLTVYRGMQTNTPIKDFARDTTLTSLTSTSTCKSKAMVFTEGGTGANRILFVIDNVLGKGADIDTISLIPENEVLFKPNLKLKYKRSDTFTSSTGATVHRIHMSFNGYEGEKSTHRRFSMPATSFSSSIGKISQANLKSDKASMDLIQSMTGSCPASQNAIFASLSSHRKKSTKHTGGFRPQHGGYSNTSGSYRPYGSNINSSRHPKNTPSFGGAAASREFYDIKAMQRKLYNWS